MWSITMRRLGNALGKLRYQRQMRRTKQKVIRDIAARQLAQSADDVVAQEPMDVRLIMYQMPNAFEFGMALAVIKRIADVRICQINPGDHPANQLVSRGQIEQPPGLFHDYIRLNDHRPVEIGSIRESGPGLRADSFFEERIRRAASMGSRAGSGPRNAGERRFASTYILTLLTQLTHKSRETLRDQAQLHARGTAIRNQRTARARRGSDAARDLYQRTGGTGVPAAAAGGAPAESSAGRISFSLTTCGQARRVSRRRKAGAARSARRWSKRRGMPGCGR